MMESKICQWEKCGVTFTPKSKNAKFCCEAHKRAAFNKAHPFRWRKYAKTLNGTAASTPVLEQQHKPLPQVDIQQLNRVQEKLSSSDQLVFKLLMDQNKELKDELKISAKEHADHVKQLTAKLEAITKENNDLDKQLSDAQRQLSDKPKGLSGFLETNPQTVKETILEGLPMVVELVKSLQSGNSGGQVPPFVQFLYKRPEEEQKQFMAIMQTIMANETDFPVHLQNITRNLMAAATQQQVPGKQQVNGTSRYS